MFHTESLSSCALCPRRCMADRLSGETGFCGAGVHAKVARAALHFWEEPCISGTRGSGAVFFSHCTLGCVFCQNTEISRGGRGTEVNTDGLAAIFLSLQKQGAHNLNLVTPTHYALQITGALAAARQKGLTLPVVYNCGGYERVEVLRDLEKTVDVWLPDFKFADGRYSARYCGVSDYPETALFAIGEMLRQTGPALFDADGMLCRGVLVRHLLLPGLLFDSMKAVRTLYEQFGDDIVLSLMSQYTPMPRCEAFPSLCRTINSRHYEALVDFAASLGITRCYVQEPDAASAAFIPAFDGEGVSQSVLPR